MADLGTVTALKENVDTNIKVNSGTHDTTKTGGADVRTVLGNLIDTILGEVNRNAPVFSQESIVSPTVLAAFSKNYLVSSGMSSHITQPVNAAAPAGTTYNIKRVNNDPALNFILTGLSGFDPANPDGFGTTELLLAPGDCVTLQKWGTEWYIMNLFKAV